MDEKQGEKEMKHILKDLQEERVIIGDFTESKNVFTFEVVNVGEVTVVENMDTATVLTEHHKVTMQKLEVFDFLASMKENEIKKEQV